MCASRIPGESPPPPPRACFGRDELIEEIVGLAETLTPIALIGAGGIGKTSIALTVLHDDRIKQRFGDDRRFIRCDQFPASCNHFLNQLSRSIGAGVKNPRDLAPLRPFLSSREILIVLDNAESVLDPQGTSAQGVYAVVEELSQLSKICLCITSRISTIPPDCKTLSIPTLSIESARDVFHRIYKNIERPDLIDNILEQLEFHPLSITLLATVAHHNQWNTDRLAKEWERQRTGLLHTQHNKSLAAAIELSLTSPMFQELDPDARGLLSVVAFFPRGVDENNLDWLFPTISDRANIFDKFCILSLTYRSNGFITMLAPLRDHLRPEDPKSSPLLAATKECYFSRLSARVDPGKPGYEEARWIMLEDVNVEHLLDVFTSVDKGSGDVWDACAGFMRHLYRHKPRLIMLGSKIEGLPDDHPSKPEYLLWLSRLLDSVGNCAERKRLLIRTLELWRERGDDHQVARTLRSLSDVNRLLNLPKEGIRQVEEALEICRRLKDVHGQASSLQRLAPLLFRDNQPDAAKDAASRAIKLSGKSDQFQVCQCYRILGKICTSKGETEAAIDHFEAALGIASSSNWRNQQFRILSSMADLFIKQGRFDEAHTHTERARSHAVDNAYHLGWVTELQARVWYGQHMLEKAKSEALHAVEVFERLGATKEIEDCRRLLRKIESRTN